MSTKVAIGRNVVNGELLVKPAKGGSLTHKIVTIRFELNGRRFKKKILLDCTPSTQDNLRLLVVGVSEQVVQYLMKKLGTELNILLLPHTTEEAEQGDTLEEPQVEQSSESILSTGGSQSK